jgi:hypothetical protein
MNVTDQSQAGSSGRRIERSQDETKARGSVGAIVAPATGPGA